MKKEYFSPATKVFVIHTNNEMLAGTQPPEGENAGAKKTIIGFDESSDWDDDK